MTYSALPAEAFKAALFRAQARFQQKTRLIAGDGDALIAANWIWPEPAAVQALLREHAMRGIVAPGEHTHENPVEIRAEIRAAKGIKALRVQFPDEFQRVLVVSYRPSQTWVVPGQPSPTIKF